MLSLNQQQLVQQHSWVAGQLQTTMDVLCLSTDDLCVSDYNAAKTLHTTQCNYKQYREVSEKTERTSEMPESQAYGAKSRTRTAASSANIRAQMTYMK